LVFFGLVASTIAEQVFGHWLGYSPLIGGIDWRDVVLSLWLLIRLIGFFWKKIRRNPYPLVFKCLKEWA